MTDRINELAKSLSENLQELKIDLGTNEGMIQQYRKAELLRAIKGWLESQMSSVEAKRQEEERIRKTREQCEKLFAAGN